MTSPRDSLGHFGERRLISELLFQRYGDSILAFGDDSAVVLQNGQFSIIATTDPAPKPVAWQFGFEDYYYWGWLLAAINLSDIAAAGGEPLGLLSSLTLPSDMTVLDFNRLLDGIDDCCSDSGTHVIGGNLKEAVDGHVRCEGTAFGRIEGSSPLSRTGASAGDVIIALGPTGYFWSGILTCLRSQETVSKDSEFMEVVLRPRPLVSLGYRLRVEGVLKSCTDASDGLYASVSSLTADHGLGAILSLDEWKYPTAVRRASRELSVDPARLALGFGDLQLVATVDPENVGAAQHAADAEGTHCMILGEVTAAGGIRAVVNGRIGTLSNFDNERFSAESQFTAGLDAYWARLLERPLLAETAL